MLSTTLLLLTTWATTSTAFLAPRPQPFVHSLSQTALSATDVPSLIVVSPPGGVGEVTAVKAAEMGSAVRWFVVSQTGNQQVVLAQESLDTVATAGGSIDFAGADAESLLLPVEDAKSAIQAVSAWSGAADSIVCTFDGVQDATGKPGDDGGDPVAVWEDAIKVAAREASKAVSGTKLAIASALDGKEAAKDDEDESGGLGSLVGNLFSGGKAEVPATLSRALSQDTSKVSFLRHGTLFGVPESSPDFSPLVGGPRRDPELCQEYQMRAIRVDPTLSISGNVMMGSNTESSRHTVGEAAALMSLGKVPFKAGVDVCVSSQRGSEPAPVESWQQEFARVEKMLTSGEGAQLFTAEFTSVPDVERLADWLAAKWAPAVLRTYDIATIRSGARPVFTTRAGEGKVEIVWQELVNFESTTVGRMLIQVSDAGLVAVRGPGDATKGFGSISKEPLPGESVLVRRLAEAASQAIEKGLAKKVCCFDQESVLVLFCTGRNYGFVHQFSSQTICSLCLQVTKKPKVEKPKPQPVAVAAPVVTSIQSSGTVPASPAGSESGPRKAGARRSKERARGRKSKSRKS